MVCRASGDFQLISNLRFWLPVPMVVKLSTCTIIARCVLREVTKLQIPAWHIFRTVVPTLTTH